MMSNIFLKDNKPRFFLASICLYISVFVISLLFCNKAFSQGIIASVIGKVTDSEGKGIAGVEVYVKESGKTALSQKLGLYNLNIEKSDSIIVFSKLGYIKQELNIQDRKVINVKLEAEKSLFNEIVNVGYGVLGRREVSGALTTVKTDDFIKAPVGSFDEALAGRMAGVKVSSLTGQPGENMDIVIRGANSLYKNYAPLYVIDGVVVENIGNVTINPEEIASLTVLKDASLTSIYGSRGANGVVVIDTKRGYSGKSVVSLNTTVGFQQFANKIKMMDSYDFVKYQTEVNEQQANELYNRASLNSSDPLYNASGRTLSSYQNITGTDWQDEIFRTSPMQIHNIGIRGGDKDTKYAISGSIFDQNGVIINSGANRYQGRVTLDQTISKKIKIGFTVNYGYNSKNGYAVNGEETSSPAYYGLFRVWGARPVSGESNLNLIDYTLDPDYSSGALIKYNPVISLENESKKLSSSNLLAVPYVEYDILKNLKFRSTASINSDKDRLDIFYNSSTPGGNTGLQSNGSFRYIKSRYFTNENTLKYHNIFKGAHAVEAMAGFAYYNGMKEMFGYGSSMLPNEDFGIYGLDEGVINTIESGMSKYSFKSYFGNANYSFKSRYSISLSLRGDELSFLRKEIAYSPSFSVAWNIKGENFLKSSKAISTSKLRFGYGQIKDWLYSPYNFISILGISDVSLGAFDLDRKWEATTQYNLGYDLGLFKDRIALSIDLYKKDTGEKGAYLAAIRNEGMELSLNTTNIQTGNFRWTSAFNIAFNRSKILSLNGTDAIYSSMGINSPSSSLYVNKVGSPLGMFYGYVFDGIYQVEDFDYVGGVYTLKSGLSDNGSPRGTIQPGYVKYKDLDGNGTIDQNDQTAIGRSAPKHIGGFLNNLNYKAFDLSVLFQWSYGNQIYNANRMWFEGNYQNTMGLNQYASYNNRWTPENRSNELFKTGGAGPADMQSNRVLEDGSYLRLKTISLGYSIPKKSIKALYLSQLTLRVSAQNLFTITKYSGLDPEVSVRHSALTAGFDYAAYPQARTISLGLHATF